MRKSLRLLCVLTAFLAISFSRLPSASAQINGPLLEGMLNGLVTPKLVNESNKPELGDRSAVAETVDPASGTLSLAETDLTLPGKDGLDLDLKRMYNSSQAEVGTKRVSVSTSTSQQVGYGSGYYVNLMYIDMNTGGYGSYFPGYYSTQASAFSIAEYYINNQPDRGRYYVDALVEYKTVQYVQITYTTTTKIYPDENAYIRQRYDLGGGWSMAFPSLQIDNGYVHYHDGEGGAYVVKFDANNRGKLEDYGRSDVELTYNSAYSNGQMNSTYMLTDQHKKKTYFGNDGRLLGIRDRFNNEIKFTHINRAMNGRSYPVISKIVDSVGRNVNFAYQSNLNDANFDTAGKTENITITVTHPSTSETKTIVYAKKREQVSIFENGNLIGRRYEPYLAYVTDVKGYSTYYNYYLASEAFSATSKSLSNSAGTAVYLLQYAMYPNSTTFYEYTVVPRNWGAQGAYQAFKVTARWDSLNRYNYDAPNPSIYGTGLYNERVYTYFGDVTGYPTHYAEEAIPESYRFGSEITNNDGVKSKYTFNGKKQLLSMEQTALNGEKTTQTIQSYDSVFKYKPLKVQNKVSKGNAESLLYQLYAYYPSGDLKSETKPMTAAQMAAPAQVQELTVSYEYEPTYKLPSAKRFYQASGILLSEEFTYDTLGRVKSIKNANGELTTFTHTSSSAGRTEESVQTLENGKVAKTITVYGQTAYQLFPTSVQTMYTDAYGSPNTSTQTYTYNMLLGTLATETDANNQTTSYSYDAYGRQTVIKSPAVNNQNGERYQTEQILEYFDQTVDNSPNYFDEDNKYLLTTRIDGYTRTVRLNDGAVSYDNVTHEFYDGFGNLVLKGQYESTTGEELVLAQYHYDIMGRPEYGADINGNVVRAAYDAWGRMFETTDAFGHLYRTDVDAVNRRQTSYLVAAGDIAAFRRSPADSLKQNVLESASDNWGREISRKAYPRWPDRTQQAVEEQYAYDLLNNMTRYVDPNGNVTAFAYDKLNRLTRVTDALGQNTAYAYNKLGQLKSATQGDGTQIWQALKDYDETGFMTTAADTGNQTMQYSRNRLGQVQNLTDPNGNPFYYTYDETGRELFKTGGSVMFRNIYQFRPFGPTQQQETRSGSSFLTIYHDYNIYGSQTFKADLYDGVSTVVRHAYDQGNRLLNIADAADYFTHYGYDKTRINRVQTNGSHVPNLANNANATYDYEPDGKLKAITYPRLQDGSILRSEYRYDQIGRLLAVSHLKSGSVMSEYSYTHDANGNIVSATDGTGKTVYEYDALNRLKKIVRPTGQIVEYGYDLRGNRRTLKDDGGFEDEANAQLTYNVWDQLKSFTKNGTTTEFEYEMQGLRLSKTSEGHKTRYAYNNDGKVITESNASNQTIANYVWGPDRLLAKRDAQTNKKYYYLYNGHGDVVQIVDEAGQTVNQYTYDEWGNLLQNDEQIPNAFKYAGEMLDEETGLYYLRARYYDPGTGRFISKDTYEGEINNPLSLNLYTYVYNNPLIYIDPTGNKPYYSFYNKVYNLYFSHKMEETIKNVIGMIPFVGGMLADKTHGVQAFDTTDMKDAAKYLTQFSFDAGGMYSSKFQDVKLNSNTKAIKNAGKILGAIGTALTINDFWQTIKYDNNIDKIIEYHFIGPGKGDYMTGETRGQLFARYLYATDRISELIEEGKVTHISEKVKVKDRNFFDSIELDRLQKELLLIK